MKKPEYQVLTVVLLAFVAFMLVPQIYNMIKGPADTPALFSNRYTIEQASEQSYLTGKPVLILVTADWCGPCQALKRGALSDPKVAEWIRGNMIPVYLEDGANADQIRMLPVNSFPTTLILKDGDILGQFSGNKSPDGYLSRIRDLASKS